MKYVINFIETDLVCPRCRRDCFVEIEFHATCAAHTKPYHLGDRVEWDESQDPSLRPPGGSCETDGYAGACNRCQLDFWTKIAIRSDVISRIEVDPSRPGIIPDPDAGAGA